MNITKKHYQSKITILNKYNTNEGQQQIRDSLLNIFQLNWQLEGNVTDVH